MPSESSTLTDYLGKPVNGQPRKFGIKLQWARRSRGIRSAASAAQICGLPADSWERWEAGQNEPKAGAFLRILFGLNIPADYFEVTDFEEGGL